MNKTNWRSIGVMSGTSLDGVDICYVHFNISGTYTFEIIKAATIPYPMHWRHTLTNAFTSDKETIKKVDIEYGEYLGMLISDFIEENSINTVDFIASHGHTIFHKPEEGITLQIGNGQKIAEITGKTVVNDFRTRDVQLGGQGAPLVPIGDALLFGNYHYCINLGGFANISFDYNQKRIAYDICPVNIVLNKYIRTIGKEFDNKGQLAASGSINYELLQKLNDLTFYKLPAPKSLGLEWVEATIFNLIDPYKLSLKDILRTYTEHAAIQIANSFKNDSNVLVTGGGAYNDFLMDRIKGISGATITLPDPLVIDFKEALVFAFLGLLRINGEVNVLSSVTGARHDHSSGNIIIP